MLPGTVSHGNSAASWNISVEGARVSTRSGGGAVESGDQVQQRALPAAGRADQAEELARRDVEGEAVEGDDRARRRVRTT